MPDIPLLIIGAGPAGLSTALHLVQADPAWAARLIVLEKAAHPRPKLCGGGVTRLGLEILQALGLPSPLPLPQAAVTDARMVYGRQTIHIRGDPEFVVFHRQELDAYLAETARQRGIRLVENVRVLSIQTDAAGVSVHTTGGDYRARAVVGADGSKGLTRRAVTGPGRVARLLEVIDPAPENAPQFTEAYALFDFTQVRRGLQGYTWDFPARVAGQPHFNRGIYDARFWPAYAKPALPALLAEALAGLGAGPQRVKVEGHPIHWFSPTGRVAAPRILLAGDAAGADPLFGEGIAPALAYGKIAARAVEAAFRRDDFSFRGYRARVLFSPLGGYLLFRWLIAWWGFLLGGQDWYMRLVWMFGGLAAAWHNFVNAPEGGKPRGQ